MIRKLLIVAAVVLGFALSIASQAAAQTSAPQPPDWQPNRDRPLVPVQPQYQPSIPAPLRPAAVPPTLEDPYGDSECPPVVGVMTDSEALPVEPEVEIVPGPPPFESQIPALPSQEEAAASDARPGVFQKIQLLDTWLPRFGDGGFGMNDVELNTIWGLPLPSRNSPLVITPGVAAHFLDGPSGVDLPPRVYDAYTEFRWLPMITDQLRADIAVEPGYYTDFKNTSSKAFRITGHGSAIWTTSKSLQFVLGVAYLNRRDTNFLPIAGVIIKPNPDSEYSLVFPQPKIAFRTYFDGYLNIEHWVYVAGELGGGTWAIQHTDGTDDIYDYSDWRVLLGAERKVIHGLDSQIEVGYVFHRKVQLESLPNDIHPNSTGLVQAALRY